MNRPLIAIPMGDAAGIGPEIILKAVANPTITERARCFVVGSRAVLEQAMSFPHMPSLSICSHPHPEAGHYAPGILNLLDLDNICLPQLRLGQISAMCGQAAYESIKACIDLAMTGAADAIATPPINKESLRAAGVPYIGHTEIFGVLTNTPDPLTMFEVRGLRVFFLSRHISLRQACDQVKKDRIIDYVKRCTHALHRLGVQDGCMAIAGLNPHSGEHGLFGREEMEEVVPAVHMLQELGYSVEGPVSADSVFHLAREGRYNSVLSLYHDQGHIATKTLDFYRTVSITNGMPILRTSVDHGTAFDAAGTGKASSVSMEEAILVAAKYAPCFTCAGTA